MTARWSIVLLAGLAWGASGCEDVNPAATVDAARFDGGPIDICPSTGNPVGPERCDGRDNDCDGVADEGFDLDNDPENCGACDAQCDFGNTITACANAECIPLGCPAGFVDDDDDLTNGCPISVEDCTPQAEQCNDEDDDCDGRADENFDKAVNIQHCGGCDQPCVFPNATPFCDGGRCRIRRCDPDWGNIDGNELNGCEERCAPQNPGLERCDLEDNDCDGATDEIFDLATDVENCGACGVRCGFANAAARCVASECAMDNCDEGFVDLDGLTENGCEQRCEETNLGVEICDSVDNNCDGVVDDGFDLQNDPENCGGCGSDDSFICRLPNTVPTCAEGVCTTDNCVEGFTDADGRPENGCETVCVVQNEGEELCNGIDDDCDGRADEPYDLQTDVANCGRCGTACDYENANGRCDFGRCVLPPDGCADGWVDADQDALTGCEYECTVTGAEDCNGVDDDCDTVIDEGYDIFRELDHCGGCYQACETPNAIPVCNVGDCEIGGCDPGWFDADDEVATGCEFPCEITNGGIEICDGVDNDCNDAVDEPFDLTSNVQHCGGCGNACDYPNGRTICVDSTCRVEGCIEGWFDANGDLDDGCELRCVVSNGGVEVCDNADNDCDGAIDEGFDLARELDNCGACGNTCAFDNGQPLCIEGRCALTNCNPGWADVNRDPTDGCEYRCEVGDVDGVEFCNGEDDDCDGVTDEGFDLETDIDHCGACGRACDLQNSNPFCSDGACLILSCLPGAVDLDDQPDNGCECRTSNGSIEICDGLDNDCNGVVDDPERVVPPPEEACEDLGICRGTSPTCEDARWRCDYGDDYEPDETRCDGLDNDCDGTSDEAFVELGRPCTDGEGICRVDGRIECSGVGEVACTANAADDRRRNETCNGLDDDCDGRVDEDSDIVVSVPGGGGVAAFSMYVYEASRTDADAGTAGQSFARACSKADVQPWTNVDYATAVDACASAGMRLCTAAEWGRACAGPAGQSYPYGDVFDPERCNGQAFDTDPDAPGNQDDTLTTGALPRCSRDLGGGPVFDLSGNVWEWTSQDLSPEQDGSARAVRGGSAGNIDGGLTCDFSNASPPGAFRSNIGFRCCGAPL